MQEEKSAVILGIIVGSVFVTLFGFIMLLVIINFFKRKRKILIEQKVKDAQYEQAVLQAQLEMQEHTFKTISQEIHDNVGQILSLAKVNLNIITLENEGGNDKINTVKDLVGKAITDLRDLSMGYYADRLAEEGLLFAIQHELNQLQKTNLFTVSFTSELEDLKIEKNKSIFLYRMMQEILNNIVKHSHATHVAVQVLQENNKVKISVQDNGVGFDFIQKNFKPGIGLTSLQKRAAMIDCTLQIESEPNKGTTVNLTFLLND